MSSSRDQLERDLRAAARDFDDVVVSSTAWQDNQRRLVDRRSRRSRRVLGAAAAVVVLAVVGALVVRGGPPPGVPADGEDDPFASAYILAEPVTAETVTVADAVVAHEVVLSDLTGAGPQLCDRYAGVEDPPRCTPRDRGADDPEVAVDWLTGYSVETPRRGVVAGLDRRVAFVAIWLTDGRRVEGELLDGGWEGSRLLALTVDLGAPVPQRLVAYGRDGNVLQSVDLVARFGDSWLEERYACAGDQVADLPANGDTMPNAYIALGTVDAQVRIRLSQDDSYEPCLERLRATAVAGWTYAGPMTVLVLAPETELVGVQVDARIVEEVKPKTVPGTLWRVVVLGGLTPDELARATLVAYDRHGLELDRVYVSQPMTP